MTGRGRERNRRHAVSWKKCAHNRVDVKRRAREGATHLRIKKKTNERTNTRKVPYAMLSPAVVFDGLGDNQRPTPSPDLTETLYEAEGNGWSAQGLRDHLKARIPTSAGTGAVIWHLRQAAANEPTKAQETKTRKDEHLTHQECPDGHTGCQLCWCMVCKPTCSLPHQHHRTPTHHRPTPIPSDLANELRAIIARTRVPK